MWTGVCYFLLLLASRRWRLVSDVGKSDTRLCNFISFQGYQIVQDSIYRSGMGPSNSWQSVEELLLFGDMPNTKSCSKCGTEELDRNADINICERIMCFRQWLPIFTCGSMLVHRWSASLCVADLWCGKIQKFGAALLPVIICKLNSQLSFESKEFL